jgi:hypothetical protein
MFSVKNWPKIKKRKKNCVEMWCKKFDKPIHYKNPTKTLELLNPKTTSIACGKQQQQEL